MLCIDLASNCYSSSLLCLDVNCIFETLSHQRRHLQKLYFFGIYSSYLFLQSPIWEWSITLWYTDVSIWFCCSAPAGQDHHDRLCQSLEVHQGTNDGKTKVVPTAYQLISRVSHPILFFLYISFPFAHHQIEFVFTSWKVLYKYKYYYIYHPYSRYVYIYIEGRQWGTLSLPTVRFNSCIAW